MPVTRADGALVAIVLGGPGDGLCPYTPRDRGENGPIIPRQLGRVLPLTRSRPAPHVHRSATSLGRPDASRPIFQLLLQPARRLERRPGG